MRVHKNLLFIFGLFLIFLIFSSNTNNLINDSEAKVQEKIDCFDGQNLVKVILE